MELLERHILVVKAQTKVVFTVHLLVKLERGQVLNTGEGLCFIARLFLKAALGANFGVDFA